MLRLLVLLLLLANGLYFAWSEGLLRNFGFAPAQQREPQRVAQQILPEAVRVLTTAEIKKVDAQVQADMAPKECLQAGPFDETQATALRQVLEAELPSGAWQLDTVVVPAHWIVYMGKFANEEALIRKRGELLAMRLTPHAPNNPDLEPGLSLGVFDTEAAASAELASLGQRGIRTAKVVQERPEGHSTLLRLPAVSETLKPQLNGIKPALAGKSLTACR